MAKKRHGKCLSRVYVKIAAKLLWCCRNGHKWRASPNSIRQGSWCPRCVGQGKTILDMRGAARRRNGKCLSNRYNGAFVKLQWQCSKGHVFSAAPTHVLNHGSWCPQCSFGSKRLSLKQRQRKLLEMKHLARSRNGWCLSTDYVNGHTRLRWRCRNGHEWLATAESVKNAGTWCATCGAGISERICRAVFEGMFASAFPKKKPAWLQSTRRTRMELDGYSEELGIAFEYQGVQHFVRNSRFHRGRATLERRMADDRRKAALCRKHGIILLQIPYTVPHAKFEKYIRQSLKTRTTHQHTKEILKRGSTNNIDLSTLNAYSPARLVEMQELAKKHGGQCLSTNYINNTTKLRWRCEAGHVWEATPVSIKMGNWCHECSGYRRYTLADMQALARKRGGECLATKYHGNRTKILWRCAKGHLWSTTPGGVVMGAWCPYCANRPPITIKDVRALARTRRGKCLSTQYANAQCKLHFRCAEGHVWKTNWNRLQQGMWCPVCGKGKTGKERRLTIDLMCNIARGKGGLCISKEYVNSGVKLLWRCQHGHQWSATPANVRRGTWCPVCAGRKALSAVSQMG